MDESVCRRWSFSSLSLASLICWEEMSDSRLERRDSVLFWKLEGTDWRRRKGRRKGGSWDWEDRIGLDWCGYFIV